MKTSYTFKINISLLILGFSMAISAKSPDAINYQAVVRNTEGMPVINKQIAVKISILSGITEKTEFYTEVFHPTTNHTGQIALEIGRGNVMSGNFSGINWSQGDLFIQVGIDLDNGTDFSLTSTSQLLTVPYAKFADVSGKTVNENQFVKYSENIPDSTVYLSPKHNSDSLRKFLQAGYRNFVLRAGAVYTFSNIALPSNISIFGNGAFVIPGNSSSKCFTLSDVTNVRLRDIVFRGQIANAAGSALNTAHIAVQILRSQDISIQGCTFKNWLGAGLVFQGSTSRISYYNYRMIITANQFDQCFFGVSIADRSEYSIFSNNILTSCRVGTWHSSGNWNITGNSYVTCRAPYLSYGKSSPFGQLSSDNWNHGSFTNNILNHSNSGGNCAWGSAAFNIGGVLTDPTGVVINNVLPPTFCGNTLYYTNLDFSGVTATSTSTPWQITGCVFSQMTINASATGVITLVGCSKQANVTVSSNIIEK